MSRGRLGRLAVMVTLGAGVGLAALAAPAAATASAGPAGAVVAAAAAAPAGLVAGPAVPAAPTPPVGPVNSTSGTGGAQVGVQINGPNGKPSSSIVILLAMTVLSVAPALLLMCTS